MSDTTLITLTGDRPEAFALCERFMARQTDQDWHWIVVDDGREPTPVLLADEVLRFQPEASPSESFRRNKLNALNAVSTDKVIFIEDDDWYSPLHVEWMKGCMGKATDRRYLAVGQAGARYYNVKERLWKLLPSNVHASLCQTGISHRNTRDLLVRLLRASNRPEHLDMTFWKHDRLKSEYKFLCPVSTTCVGIKGMPGRVGLGVGHKQRELLVQRGYQSDPEMATLRKWIGDDVENYKDV